MTKPTTALALRENNNGAPVKTRKRMGRRSLYSAQLQKRICKLLEKGNTIIATCDSVGITDRTYHEWCETKPHFFQATSRARGKARLAHVKAITKAGETDWRARAWLLSHIWSGEYSEQTRMDVALGGVVLIPSKSEGSE